MDSKTGWISTSLNGRLVQSILVPFWPTTWVLLESREWAWGLWGLTGGEGLDLVAQLPIADTSRCVRCWAVRFVMPITINRGYCISSCTRIFQACFRMPEVSHIIRWKSTDQPHSSHLFCGALYFSSARVSSSKDSNRVLVVSWNGRTHFLICNFHWSEPKAMKLPLLSFQFTY